MQSAGEVLTAALIRQEENKQEAQVRQGADWEEGFPLLRTSSRWKVSLMVSYRGAGNETKELIQLRMCVAAMTPLASEVK